MEHNTANHSKFPWTQVVGFILSIALTFLAIWFGLYAGLAYNVMVPLVFVLAFIQAAIQLFMFMHVTEGEGKWQVGKMISATVIVLIIVLGTIWVMVSMH
ncbi:MULTISPECIES: cytochrome aa3 quinol oxidase subunit IV [Rossellomorea]|jgi:cytochrome aa3-600 menaquinol oxidase subunit IV|uniref:Quinol oxidase subunit 4 n=1 Tax=Rossellomorea marisflavi TaxID=189381 RepID=A0A0J5S622_9BACI|nr:cytochrome aa3 quinol oxidase subunit IV [Rossellomorea marisflavi]MBV6684140.1 cytochrome aa3 quinol oxidase subunit IV [Bacillus sp. JRC01]VXC18213.1 Quinol oxidase subunit 4 [Bacillus sp. 349Y]KMK92613.1 quinol oxidase subunit 4 [Rossellomorea marisflavi]KML05308.1 quinol oxidase subunit 4 [Rossellomorea marisflavi]KML28795.1 quinol oxidase subunit 4 [Rossellomorea marisflavi]